LIKVLFSLGIYRASQGDRASLARCDRWFAASGIAKGVLVVTHGLNLLPSRMDELCETFAGLGYEVLRPGFFGHHGDVDEFLRVSAAEWEEDARRIHAEAKSRSDSLSVPLHLIAYSFSGLIFQVHSKELPFHRRVYLAPALALHFWFRPLMWLARLIPWLTFTSVIPEGYGANHRSGILAPLALEKYYLRWRRFEGREVPGQALIWASPKDELVRTRGLRKLAGKIPGWQFRETSVEGSTLPKKYHHLIVDSSAVGPSEWSRLVAETNAFLECS